jgi:phosphocarrier protein HPr
MSQGDAPEDCPPTEIPNGALGRELPIINKKGLHARASAKFVQTVERFDADVTVTRCGETVGGRSIMGLLTLGAAQGTTITVVAEGKDAEACLGAVSSLVANRFGEDD